MSGILDSKSRILDAIVTVEGRRQIAAGTFNVAFATFSDADVQYITSPSEGHLDPTRNIQLEVCNLPQDQIVFEANDDAMLLPFRSLDIKIPQNDIGNFLTRETGQSYEASLQNGKLTVFQRHHGRMVQTTSINEDKNDNNKGFIYSDTTGLTASILVKSNITAGTIELAAYGGSPQKPFIAYVGTRGGMGSDQFATSISGAIENLRIVGGPSVVSAVSSDAVYLDLGESFEQTKIFATGTLSSPLFVKQGAIGGNLRYDEVENEIFASNIPGILSSSFDNFLQLQTLSSNNKLFEDETFEINTSDISFDLTQIDSNVLKIFADAPPTLNSIDSLFNDDKMSHLDNFKYLPPIIKVSDSLVPNKTQIENLTPYLLGNYPSWGNNEKRMSFIDLKKQLKSYEDTNRPIVLKKTSNANNIMGQFFEVTNNTVSKLDIVEFGHVMNDVKEPSVVTDNVFFAGKIFLDNRGTTCFVNMFTLIFSKLTPTQDQELILASQSARKNS
jgi:hypothetical protein